MGKKKFEDQDIKWVSRLKEYRNKHEYNFTQSKVAEELKVTRQTISSIESGNYNPSLILAYKIARLFKVPIEDIFVFQEKNE